MEKKIENCRETQLDREQDCFVSSSILTYLSLLVCSFHYKHVQDYVSPGG